MEWSKALSSCLLGPGPVYPNTCFDSFVITIVSKSIKPSGPLSFVSHSLQRQSLRTRFRRVNPPSRASPFLDCIFHLYNALRWSVHPQSRSAMASSNSISSIFAPVYWGKSLDFQESDTDSCRSTQDLLFHFCMLD